MKLVTELRLQQFLAQAIAKEGCKYVSAGMNPMDLKRGIDTAVAAVIQRLERQF